MDLWIRNGLIISPGLEPRPGVVEVVDGVIRRVSARAGPPSGSVVLDAGGGWVMPGFVDIHTHGAAGVAAMDGTEEAVRGFAQAKLGEGVTTFLPSTWTASPEALLQAARAVRAYQGRMDFARAPGLHLEGPFLNPACLGAMDPAHVRPPSMEEVDRIARECPVRVVTLSTEVQGGLQCAARLKERGIIPSLGHTAATFEQFLAAKRSGVQHLTHFGNQMRPLHHREIGMVGAGLLDGEVRLELIADGIHLCPDMIRLLFRCVSAKRILLITDSISASGMPDGSYRDGGLAVTVKDGVCRLENGALAGSTLRFNRALKVVMDATGKPVEQVVACTAWNQAVSLGLENTGKVEPGFVADLVIVDPESCEVRATVVGGEVRWKADT